VDRLGRTNTSRCDEVELDVIDDCRQQARANEGSCVELVRPLGHGAPDTLHQHLYLQSPRVPPARG
jgi:hypothetical protein